MKKSVVIRIRLHPGARHDEISGWMSDGSLKVRVKSKPIEGRANENLLKFLSKLLKVPSSNLQIKSGWKSKNKLVKISGLDQELFAKIITSKIN